MVATTAAMLVPGLGPAVAVAKVGMMAYKAASAMRVASVIARAGKVIMSSSKVGLQSAKFGSKSFGKVEGSLNKAGSRLKIGWDKHNGANEFRIGIGRKTYYNVKRAKQVTVSRVHIKILRFNHR